MFICTFFLIPAVAVRRRRRPADASSDDRSVLRGGLGRLLPDESVAQRPLDDFREALQVSWTA